MKSLNSVTLSGRLGGDPEITYTSTGRALAKISLALPYAYKAGEEWKEETTWVRVTFWGNIAERLANVKKGEYITVTGKLSVSQWTTKEGEKRSSLEITGDDFMRYFFSGGSQNDNSAGDDGEEEQAPPPEKPAATKQSARSTNTRSAAKGAPARKSTPDDDDLPF